RRTGAQRILIANGGIDVTSEWHIETIVAIDAIKPIEARLVQINEPRSDVGVGSRVDVHLSEAVKELAFVPEASQLADDFLDVVFDALVGPDQTLIHVGKYRTLRLQREEQRSASDERLEV